MKISILAIHLYFSNEKSGCFVKAGFKNEFKDRKTGVQNIVNRVFAIFKNV